MTSVPDLQGRRLLDDRSDEPTLLREERERREHVELPDRAGQPVEPGNRAVELAKKRVPGRRLLVPTPFPRVEDPLLDRGELLRREPLPGGERLLPAEVRRHPAQVGPADVEVVPEDLVVADLQPTDPGGP